MQNREIGLALRGLPESRGNGATSMIRAGLSRFRLAGAAVLLGAAIVTSTASAMTLQPPGATPDEKADIAAARSLSRAFQHVAKRAEPSVVHITSLQQVYTRRSLFDAPRAELAPGGLGSGVIVTEDGYILTNNHVVAGADQLRVRLADGRELECQLVGADPATDLAVLKVDATGLPILAFGDSDALEVGEWVVAIGSPFGFDSSVTAGIVSAKGRSGIVGRRSAEGLYEEFIQTDAAINPGNSGGPLLDLDGRVVGINTAIITRSGGSIGLGFAIPAKMARSVMENIIASGRPQRGFLGAVWGDIDVSRAARLGLAAPSGAIIEGVMPESPADRAGLRVGDVVVAFDGKPVDSFNRLRNAIAFTPPGQTISVEVLRDGDRRVIEAQIADREEWLAAARREESIESLGITVINAVRLGASGFGDADAGGVQIASVAPGGLARREGLEPGDLIYAINGRMIANVAELRQALQSASWRQGVRIDVERGNRRGYVIIRR